MAENFKHDYREALFHLQKYADISVSAADSLNQALTILVKDTVDPLYFITFSQIMLILDNYLVEYDSFLTSSDPRIQSHIRQFKLIVHPAISTLRRWRGLRDFRNTVLAHSFRLRREGNKSVFRDGEYYLYEIPQTGHELNIIISCVKMINRVMRSMFADPLLSVIEEFEKVKLRVRRQVFYRKYTNNTRLNEIAIIEKEINLRIRKFNEGNSGSR